MSEMKHTPGPWTYQFGDICGADDNDGDTVVIGSIGRSFGLRSEPYAVVRRGEEKEANARLIAAAPDLLEALLAVEMARHTDAKEDWLKATELTDAAIVKATVSK